MFDSMVEEMATMPKIEATKWGKSGNAASVVIKVKTQR